MIQAIPVDGISHMSHSLLSGKNRESKAAVKRLQISALSQSEILSL